MTIKKTFFFLALFSVVVAIAAYRQAGGPSIASDRIKQGNACYDNKEYSKAISIYTKAVRANPKSVLAALAHYKCAKAFEAMGKYNDAISECSKSIAIDPLMNMAVAYFLRGFLYEKTGSYIDALSDYSKVLIINPDDKAASLCRKRTLLTGYAEFTKEGLAAFDSGVNAYNGRDYLSARKDLGRALSLFAYARRFDNSDKTAFGMMNFTKGLLHQMIARKILDAMKPADSNYATVAQLRKVYYPLAAANTYYDSALLCLKDERRINSVKERKAVNDRDMAMVADRLPKLEYGSGDYMKAVELEAECIVNFDAASELLAAGDHEGAGQVLNKNDNLAAKLKRLESVNADGISRLSGAYAGINTILSHPLRDTAWIRANKASLENEINACINDLDAAKSGLMNAGLINTCSGLLQNVSVLRKTIEEAGK